MRQGLGEASFVACAEACTYRCNSNRAVRLNFLRAQKLAHTIVTATVRRGLLLFQHKNLHEWLRIAYNTWVCCVRCELPVSNRTWTLPASLSAFRRQKSFACARERVQAHVTVAAGD